MFFNLKTVWLCNNSLTRPARDSLGVIYKPDSGRHKELPVETHRQPATHAAALPTIIMMPTTTDSELLAASRFKLKFGTVRSTRIHRGTSGPLVYRKFRVGEDH